MAEMVRHQCDGCESRGIEIVDGVMNIFNPNGEDLKVEGVFYCPCCGARADQKQAVKKSEDGKELHAYYAEVEDETPKALFISIYTREQDPVLAENFPFSITTHWMPKSQVDESSEVKKEGDKGMLTITKWISEKKGLIGKELSKDDQDLKKYLETLGPEKPGKAKHMDGKDRAAGPSEPEQQTMPVKYRDEVDEVLGIEYGGQDEAETKPADGTDGEESIWKEGSDDLPF